MCTFVCVCVRHVIAGVLRDHKRALDSLELPGCELPDAGARTQTQVLCKSGN